MRPIVALLCVLALLGWSLPIASAQTSPFYKGVSLVFHGYDSTDSSAIKLLLDQLQQMNVNTLLVTFPVYMDSWDASSINALHEGNDIHQYADSPTIEELSVVIEQARDRGFEVWLRPLLDEAKIVQTGPSGAWRGTIQPADLDSFFRSYESMVTYYATTPEVSWLVVGTELNSLEAPQFEEYWSAMISHLKESDSNSELQLTYAQNWDTGMHLGYPAWFGLLDGVSIDAYFPLEGLGNEATSDQIADGLAQWHNALETLKSQSPQRKLFITEAGLSSQLTEPSVLERPWSHVDGPSQVGLELQANYIAGACQSYRQAVGADGAPLVDGLFWWGTAIGAVSPDAQPLQDRGFEFIGKPGQQVIAQCYQE